MLEQKIAELERQLNDVAQQLIKQSPVASRIVGAIEALRSVQADSNGAVVEEEKLQEA
tara:strand:- start:206 stop:379 length:174 start_codon:yes stop_codon:yes gene_type:complete